MHDTDVKFEWRFDADLCAWGMWVDDDIVGMLKPNWVYGPCPEDAMFFPSTRGKDGDWVTLPYSYLYTDARKICENVYLAEWTC